jgi:hypothetical protein
MALAGISVATPEQMAEVFERARRRIRASL